MEEEFQAAVYGGGSWWLPPTTVSDHSSCSSDIDKSEPFWQSKSSDKSSDDSIVLQYNLKDDHVMNTTTDWNQSLLCRVQEEIMNTVLTSGYSGLRAEIEAEHRVVTVDEQQSSDLVDDSATFLIGSTSYDNYSSSNLVESFFSSNSPPQSPPLSPSLAAVQSHLYDFQSNSDNMNFVRSLPKRQVCGSLDQLIPSLPSQFLRSSYKEQNQEERQDLGSTANKSPGDQVPFKRPRLETPSPLPTFKVRKEKLGDRITALQQLVSPFGKTDTASVLHEAVEYIKLLHDQLNILGAPYMKGDTKPLQPIDDKVKDGEKQDLKSRGLCLVPVSTMFPVATTMATGFCFPSFI